MESTDGRTTRRQFSKMVELMETAPDIARALRVAESTSFWRNLMNDLNALGPPIKDISSWKRAWFDYKYSVKKKLRENNASLHATGGGRNKTKHLNEIEERVADLCNLRTTITGNAGRSFGYMPVSVVPSEIAPIDPTPASPNEAVETSVTTPPSEPSSDTQHPPEPSSNALPSRKRKRKNTEEILKQNQELIKIMKLKLESDAKLIETNQATVAALKETNELLKKLLERKS